MRRPLALAAVAAVALTLAGAAAPNGGRGGITYAIIGDVPYGTTELGLFPGLVQAINADPDVELTIHLGDIAALGAERPRVVTVSDRSGKANLHLTGPGVNRRTGRAFMGRATWSLRLQPGM